MYKVRTALPPRVSLCSLCMLHRILTLVLATIMLLSRPLNIAQKDEYFPSFLTALQSAPKTDTSKESAPHSRSEAELLLSKRKPRLTFAESLSINWNNQDGVEVPKESPFSFGGNYQDSLRARRRKNASSQGATNASNAHDEYILPSPTMPLLDRLCRRILWCGR